MAKIPDFTDVSGPQRLGAVGGGAVIDTSGFDRGVQNLAAGIDQLGAGLGQKAAEDKQRTNTGQVAQAEVTFTKGLLDLKNQFSQDSDWRTFGTRSDAETRKVLATAAAQIEDPEMRARWMEASEVRRLTEMDAIGDNGRLLQQQEGRATVVNSAIENAKLIADPQTPDPIRRKALADVGATFQLAGQQRMFTPEEIVQLNRTYVEKSVEDLATNRMNADILADPVGVQQRLGTSSTMGSGDVAGAMAAVAPKGVVTLDPALARLAAAQLGDKAFPTDPALAAAYLTDPKVNAKYLHATADLLTTRYKGDMTAAVIAAAPGGSPDLADQWVKSNHDEKVLPSGVRDYYRSVMEKFAPTADAVRLPVLAAKGVDLEAVDVAVLDRYEQVQSAFGKQVPILSTGGADSALVNRTAVNLDVSKLSNDERARLIETASAMGFTGVGIGATTIHLDTGARRAWGPDNGGAVPKWAEDVVARHRAGEISETPVGVANVDPRYQALPFDERLRGTEAAKQEAARQGLSLQAGIQVASDNAAAAIANSGKYDGDIPTAEDFVHAFGAADGITKFKDFDTGIQVAKTQYGMKTMTNAEIQKAMQAAVPTSTGDEAGVQTQRYDAVRKAGDTILKARDDDPAGYVISAFPTVAQAWQDVGKDPTKLAEAISVTALAQKQLGLDTLTLLPKDMADKAAAAFKDPNLSQDQRIGALTGLVLATPDETQQRAIFDQLAKTGGAAIGQTETAMDALARGERRPALRRILIPARRGTHRSGAGPG